jgi:hypothetical protein
MANISKSKTWVDNEVLNATDLNQGFDDIVNVVNGGLDSSNLAADAVGTSEIANATITNAKLSTTAGELGGVWKSWTPTLTNFTGTVNIAKYTKIGKTVFFKIKITVATCGTNPQFTLPVSMASVGAGDMQIGWSSFYDTGTLSNFGILCATGGAGAYFLAPRSDSAQVYYTTVTSTLPFTWAGGDIITGNGVYEEA